MDLVADDIFSGDEGGGLQQKKHGGRPRKAKRNEPVHFGSFLFKYLCEQWCWGAYSPQEAQRIAAVVKKDLQQVADGFDIEFSFSELDKLEKIGSFGKYPNILIYSLGEKRIMQINSDVKGKTIKVDLEPNSNYFLMISNLYLFASGPSGNVSIFYCSLMWTF